MKFETLLYEKTGHILTITMNRPERLNALNTTMRVELERAWETFRDDDDAWVGIVTGAGEKGFCTGLDLKDTAAVYERGEKLLVTKVSPAPHRIMKPLIAAVNGISCGAGMSIALESDIIISTPEATFFDPHVNTIGFAGPIAHRLPRRIPFHVAMRVLLMGNRERLSAQRAYELGFVTEIVPRERLMTRAFEIAQVIVESSQVAVQGSKEAAWRSIESGIEDSAQFLDEHMAAVMATKDNLEAVQAFMESRKPRVSS